ncbi:MAG TPA: HdeD family acid-resistance protein, partial [Woeseiaceae bacterium]|nr:HdeD family acid-resistance protein [Woeseiaceae bacterium]
FLVASGVLKLWFASRLQRTAGRGWMIAGGLLSVVLAALIGFGLPGSAMWVLGLFLGVDLIFYGITLLAIARIPRTAVL